MLDLVWLIPALPLAGFLVLLVGGRRLGEPRAGWVATLATAGSFGVTVAVFLDLLGQDEHSRHHVVTLFEWLAGGRLQRRRLVPGRPAVDHDGPVRHGRRAR